MQAVGNAGVEYHFDFPLQIAADFRPEIGIINEVDDTLEVTVSEVSCMWAENLPTGDGNESLPSDFDKKDKTKEDDLKS